MVIGIVIVSFVLVTGVALNSYPLAVAGYETTTSYPGFLAQVIFSAILQSIGVAMLLVVIVVGPGRITVDAWLERRSAARCRPATAALAT